MDLWHQFIDCLVEEVMEKVRELGHNVKGNHHLLVHLVDEAVAFEKVQGREERGCLRCMPPAPFVASCACGSPFSAGGGHCSLPALALYVLVVLLSVAAVHPHRHLLQSSSTDS